MHRENIVPSWSMNDKKLIYTLWELEMKVKVVDIEYRYYYLSVFIKLCNYVPIQLL